MITNSNIVHKYIMPAEWTLHKRCWMLWPQNPCTWRRRAKYAQKSFLNIVKAIAQFEPVTIGTDAHRIQEVKRRVETAIHQDPSLSFHEIKVVRIDNNDIWIRDTGPTFVFAQTVESEVPVKVGMDWGFNGWGGLVKDIRRDKSVAQRVCSLANTPVHAVRNFVLEGGAIHTDGEGTLLTTAQCLLNSNRNPHLTKADTERILKHHLGIEKILWLPRGMDGDDDTDGHVDGICCFSKPGQVLLAWCDDEADEQYRICREAMDVFLSETDAKGRFIEVIKMPIAPVPCLTAEECEGLEDMESDKEETRIPGSKLDGSYLNFYLPNGGIVAPSYHPETDELARQIFQTVFPDRKIIMVPGREISLGGGNIHCITQQEPELVN